MIESVFKYVSQRRDSAVDPCVDNRFPYALLSGTSTDSQQLSWRLLVLLTFVLSLLLNTYYSASMTVALLLPTPPPVRSLQDLAAASSLHLGLEDSLHTRHLLTVRFQTTSDNDLLK